MSILESISMILRQSVQKSMKSMYSHSVFLNYCVAYVYIDGLDSLNRTREIIYLSRCGCYRSICHIIAPVVKRLLVLVLLLPQLHHSFISLDVALVAGVVFLCCCCSCCCPCLPNRTGPLQLPRCFPCCWPLLLPLLPSQRRSNICNWLRHIRN